VRSSLILTVAALTIVLLVNLFSPWVNEEAPPTVSRALQWAMLTKNDVMAESIRSSSLWRKELFQRAIDEWLSDPRIFWFGRATYGFGVNDFVAAHVSGSWNATLESSLRRGATHNLLTDLLVTYGLVGCILYYCLVLTIVAFLWRVFRANNAPMPTKSLGLFCLVSSVAYILGASLGGGYYPIESTWLLILLIAVLYKCQPQTTTAAQTASALDPPGYRQQRAHPV